MNQRVNLMPRATQVFELLLQQVDQDIQAVRQEAAQLLSAGDYDGAMAQVGRAKAMEEVMREVRTLRGQWQSALQGRGTRKRASSVRRTTPRKRLMIKRSLLRPALLTALREAGGSDNAAAIVERVHKLIGHEFPREAYERDDRGRARWKDRVHWERLALVRAGYLASDSPQGIWEITEEGLQWLAENELEAKPDSDEKQNE